MYYIAQWNPKRVDCITKKRPASQHRNHGWKKKKKIPRANLGFHSNMKLDFFRRQLISSVEDNCGISSYGVIKGFRISHQLCSLKNKYTITFKRHCWFKQVMTVFEFSYCLLSFLWYNCFIVFLYNQCTRNTYWIDQDGADVNC